MKQKKIVVIGGGTGTFVVLSGLKQFDFDLSAIVTVADSGGSTGRLRDEFGFLPVGDLRQALAALAANGDQSWIQDLLLYRFSKGSGLEGHNLGNLILTALQDMTGSTAKAIEIASSIFRLHGHIYPITTHKVDLVVEYEDGQFIVGEHHLNPENAGGKKIKKIRLSPKAEIYSKAKTAIESADLVIIGPGDLYASLLPNLVVGGIKEAFANTKGKIVYIANLMTSFTQTHHMSAADHLAEIEKYLGRQVDHIVVNTQPIPPAILASYKKQHEYPVVDDLPHDPSVVRKSLIRTAKFKPQTGDAIVRSYLRHDPQKLAQVISKL